MSPKHTLVYASHSVVCLFVPQPVIVDSHWLFTAVCYVPEHPSQSHPHCTEHGARGLCSGQENTTWIHTGMFSQTDSHPIAKGMFWPETKHRGWLPPQVADSHSRAWALGWDCANKCSLLGRLCSRQPPLFCSSPCHLVPATAQFCSQFT